MEVTRAEWSSLIESVQKLSILQPLSVQEMERLNAQVEELRVRVEKIDKDISGDIKVLKIKAGMWGLIGGAIPVLITIAIALVVYFIRTRP